MFKFLFISDCKKWLPNFFRRENAELNQRNGKLKVTKMYFSLGYLTLRYVR
jgi:hypothetical protein